MKPEEVVEQVTADLLPSSADTLAEVEAFFRRYVVFGSEAQVVATALHVPHAHAIEAADATPYLHITSPEKRSGKTRYLEVYELLVDNPMRGSSMSPAIVYRVLDAGRTVLILDECDAIFAPKSDREELRGILNAGYRRGSRAWRMEKVGGKQVPASFDAFGAKVLAGIGRLPDTIQDRSITIRLQRRRSDEPLERFRYRDANAEAEQLRKALAIWASEDTIETLRVARPELPDLEDDRALEGWEPLLAIADHAGGDWPIRARAACVELHTERTDSASESAAVQTLRAIKDVFAELQADRITSEHLIEELASRDDGPWAYWFDDIGKTDRDGKPIPPRKSGRKLARTLEEFGIKPNVINIPEGKNERGYMRDWFGEAWTRWLPTTSDTLTHVENRGETLTEQTLLNVPQRSSTSVNLTKDVVTSTVADVADVADTPRERAWDVSAGSVGVHPVDAIVARVRREGR